MSNFLTVLAKLNVTSVKYTSKQNGYKVSLKTVVPTALTREAVCESVRKTVAVVTLTAEGEDSTDDKYGTNKIVMSGAEGAAQMRIALGMDASE